MHLQLQLQYGSAWLLKLFHRGVNASVFLNISEFSETSLHPVTEHVSVIQQRSSQGILPSLEYPSHVQYPAPLPFPGVQCLPPASQRSSTTHQPNFITALQQRQQSGNDHNGDNTPFTLHTESRDPLNLLDKPSQDSEFTELQSEQQRQDRIYLEA